MKLMLKVFGLLSLIWITLAFATMSHAENMLTFAWSPSTGDNLGGYRMHYGPASGEYLQTKDFGKGDLMPDGHMRAYISQDELTFFEGKFYAALVAYNDPETYETEFSNEIVVDYVPLPLTIPGDYRLESVSEVTNKSEDITTTKTYTFFKENVQ